MIKLFHLVEHVSIAVVLATSLRRLWKRTTSKSNKLRKDVEQYLGIIRQIESNQGAKSVFEWKDVVEAATASMDVSSLIPGQSTSFHDSRGSIYRFKITDGVLVNIYFTKAGVRRSGDIHDCTQYDVVMKGRTRLRMLDPKSGKEIVKEYKENDFIVIPARTPHMFEFLEDNCLLEWWSDEFKAWYYKPYRSVIDKGLPITETDGKDFSINVKEQL